MPFKELCTLQSVLTMVQDDLCWYSIDVVINCPLDVITGIWVYTRWR